MSFNFGQKKEEKQVQQQSQTEPWAPAVPYLKDFLSKLGTASGGATTGPTATQTAAADKLRTLGMSGNPNSGDMQSLADDLFATTSRSPQMESGYADLERRLTPTADGTNLDILNNPHLAAMLTKSSDDVAGRVNAQFAGAGRDLSGYNQRAIGEGVSRAQLPIMFDQYNREQGRTDAAARDLFGAKGATVTTADMLDRFATDQRTKGGAVSQARRESDAWGPQMVFDLEQKLKSLPYEDMKYIAELLFPVAGLGGSSTGTATSTGTSSGWGVGASWKDLLSLPGMR